MTGPAKKAPAKKAAVRKAPRASKKAARRWSATKPPFGPRGARLWAAHHEEVLGERGLVLLEEACRIADRLDKLDGLLRGDLDVWARLVPDDRSGALEVRVDGALMEARQQANVLRQLIVGLPLKEAAADDQEEGWVDQL